MLLGGLLNHDPLWQRRDNMSEQINKSMSDLRCEEVCVFEWVECVEQEDGASICKTRERNCFNDCKW
jgi:hypothetical protein